MAIVPFKDHSGRLAAASCHGYRPRLHARSGTGSSCALQAQSADPGTLCGTQFSYCAVRLVEADEYLVDPVAVYIGGGPPLHPGAHRKVEAPHLLGAPSAVEDKGAQQFSPIISSFNGEKATLAPRPSGMQSLYRRCRAPQWSSEWGQVGRRSYPLSTRLLPQGYG